MEELKKYYDAKLAEFATLHKKWVQSNKNMNGLYLAKQQIKDEGDTSVKFAYEALEAATKAERARNEKMTNEVNFLGGTLQDLERYIRDNFGVKLHGVIDVRGY